MSLRNKTEWRCDESGRSLAYFSRVFPTVVNRELIQELKDISEEKKKINVRICLHNNSQDSLHSMIILEYLRNKCKRPHKHEKTDEVIEIIEGKMLSLTYEERGDLINKVVLSPQNNFLYKNLKGFYHLYVPLGDYAIYSETKKGPFQHEDCIFPKWDHKNKIKEHFSADCLSCYNFSCNHPCSLRIKSK